jgi:succinate-acetate transporter protein
MDKREWRNLIYAIGFIWGIMAIFLYTSLKSFSFYWIMVAVSVVLILAFIGEHTKEEKPNKKGISILLILWIILGIILLWVLWDIGPTLLGIAGVTHG